MQSLLSGLVAYWPLHEPSGVRYDATGHGFDLTDNNTVTGNPGRVENASQFTRANTEYASITDKAELSGGDIYIHHVCWIYPDSVAAGIYAISGKANGSTYEWEFMQSTAALRIYVAPGDVSASIAASIAASTWHFVEWYHDPTDNTIAVALNCGDYTTAAITGGINDTAGSMWIGGNPATGGTAEMFGGRICEYGIWTGRRLTLQERWWLFNNGMGRTFPFDGRPAPLLTSRRGHGVMARRNRLTGPVV